jgi:hypothetical protein
VTFSAGTFENGYRAAEVCDAIVRSNETGRWANRRVSDETVRAEST